MPKNYVKNMRAKGHDDDTIKKHMVDHGWHPTQVEQLFIEIGYGAVQPTVQPAKQSGQSTLQLHVAYPANPIENFSAAITTLRAYPKLKI